MEVRTFVDETALREIKNYMLRPSMQIILIAAMIGFALLGVLRSSLYFAGTVIFAIEMEWLKRNAIRRILKQMIKSGGNAYCAGTVCFREHEILARASVVDREERILYSDMEKFAETKHQYTFFTKLSKGWKMLIINKSQFTPETGEQFLKLAAEKMPQLKIKVQ